MQKIVGFKGLRHKGFWKYVVDFFKTVIAGMFSSIEKGCSVTVS